METKYEGHDKLASSFTVSLELHVKIGTTVLQFKGPGPDHATCEEPVVKSTVLILLDFPSYFSVELRYCTSFISRGIYQNKTLNTHVSCKRTEVHLFYMISIWT